MKDLLKKYPIHATVIFTLVLFAIVLVISALSISSSAEIELLVTPASSDITIGGKSYKNGVHKLSAGTYDISIKKDGFIPQSYTINLQPGETTRLYAILSQEDGTFSWYLDHPEDDIIMKTIGDFEADASASTYLENYPILSILPIIVVDYDQNLNYVEYRIDSATMNEKCKEDFCLQITDSTGGNYDSALAKIKEVGFNPDNYIILYEFTPILPL